MKSTQADTSVTKAKAERLAFGNMVKKVYDSGQSVRQIADAYGRSYNYTNLALRDAGAKMRPSQNPAGRPPLAG